MYSRKKTMKFLKKILEDFRTILYSILIHCNINFIDDILILREEIDKAKKNV